MARYEFILLLLGIGIALFVGGVFLALLTYVIKQRNHLVTIGELDEEILKEYDNERSKKAHVVRIVTRIIDLILCFVFLFMVGTSMYAKYNGNGLSCGNIGTLKVVVSESMSHKNEKNTYLDKNGIDNQFDMYDIIIVKPLPKEEDLQLYDVVVYEKEGIEIVHRIIEIEEPNASHPNERWFVLKGDANQATDVKPVLYKQMTAIYSSQKIPFVGVFVLWMQSVLGYIIILVVLFYLIVEPIAVKNMKKVRDARIALIRK